MFSSTGKGLSILVYTDHQLGCEWMSFATWYSIVHILPDANVLVMCKRNKEEFWHLYQWAYKLRIKFCQFSAPKDGDDFTNKMYAVRVAKARKMFDGPLLVVDPDILAVRELTYTALEELEKSGDRLFSPKIWFIKHSETLPDNSYAMPGFCSEVTTNEITSFVYLKEKCGGFTKKEANPRSAAHWSFSIMPYYKSNIMSVNESKVFDLWEQMTPTFTALNRE